MLSFAEKDLFARAEPHAGEFYFSGYLGEWFGDQSMIAYAASLRLGCLG